MAAVGAVAPEPAVVLGRVALLGLRRRPEWLETARTYLSQAIGTFKAGPKPDLAEPIDLTEHADEPDIKPPASAVKERAGAGQADRAEGAQNKPSQ